MMKTLIAAAALVLALLLLVQAPIQAQGPALQDAMQEKLTGAEALFESLLQGDFAGIGQAAEALSRIDNAEIASWQAEARPEYTEGAARFLLAVDGLRTAAAERDIDAALREYTAMVTACTRCHTSLRDTAMASLGGSPGTPR